MQARGGGIIEVDQIIFGGCHKLSTQALEYGLLAASLAIVALGLPVLAAQELWGRRCCTLQFCIEVTCPSELLHRFCLGAWFIK
jgi:hypothetical protein